MGRFSSYTGSRHFEDARSERSDGPSGTKKSCVPKMGCFQNTQKTGCPKTGHFGAPPDRPLEKEASYPAQKEQIYFILPIPPHPCPDPGTPNHSLGASSGTRKSGPVLKRPSEKRAHPRCPPTGDLRTKPVQKGRKTGFFTKITT